ncbi:MAG: PLP-dependent aminotransferase family protein [Clostridiales bacterium]|nr:PLP-dependent aminotransferase family protein [Clostridiales bacterium]
MSSKTKYMQLYEELRDEILRGTYRCGEAVPSRREMVAERGVSAVTVEHAYALLCQEGYLEARARSGYRVSYRDADGFAPGGLPKPPGGLAVPMDEAEAFPFTVLARTMRRVLSDYGEEILVKSPGTGRVELRRALARYLDRSRGLRVTEEQIVIGSGAEYLYGLIVEMLGRDRLFGIEHPSYAKIREVYAAKGVTTVQLPLEADGIPSKALWACGASVLHITPYRSYPSGVTASASKRREYVRWSGEGDRILVEDDFESEFTPLTKPEETLFSLSGFGNVLYLNTFSRTISPALRVGYMVLPVRLLDSFEQKVGFYSCAVPTFEQLVLAELIESGDFARHINRVRRQRRRMDERGAT